MARSNPQEEGPIAVPPSADNGPAPAGFSAHPRARWARRPGTPSPPDAAAWRLLQPLAVPIGAAELADIYLPLATWVQQHRRTAKTQIIGVTGSVAVGKSTAARLLQTLLHQGPGAPRTALITTDGFLHPNAELARRGQMRRKGFPESYRLRALADLLAALRAGRPGQCAPVYSHQRYDIVPGAQLALGRPEVVVVEGLGLLQLPAGARPDLLIYVDAHPAYLASWYVARFQALRRICRNDPSAYLARFSHLSDASAAALARTTWNQINAPNLQQHLLPLRPQAHLILHKGPDHQVTDVWLRG